ncbi:MAG: hypothetical protein K5881_09895 [Saccharofermentans sp.]|nr:hypothetical protein [Saccharofermentans sp.]
MRKVLSLILVITMLLTLTASVSGCGSDTDYDSPIKVIAAYKNGRDVIGKTVSVTTTMDFDKAPGAGNTIYIRSSDVWSATVYVCPNEGSGTDVVKGQTVTFLITGVDDRHDPTFYIEGDVVS